MSIFLSYLSDWLIGYRMINTIHLMSYTKPHFVTPRQNRHMVNNSDSTTRSKFYSRKRHVSSTQKFQHDHISRGHNSHLKTPPKISIHHNQSHFKHIYQQ